MLNLNNHEIEFAKDILLFDLFIQTSDRTHMKPNLLTDGIKVYPIDHEISFGFTLELAFARNPEPWNIRQQDMSWINSNIHYLKLKGEKFNFTKLSDNLDGITNSFWNRAQQLIPQQWQGTRFNDVRQYLDQIIANKQTFISNLINLLS